MAGITKLDPSVGSCFVGDGDFVIFDEIADFSSATLLTLANPKSVGDVAQDSVSWDGDDVTVTPIKNTKGEIICSYATAGTFAFSLNLLNFSSAVLKKFMKGEAITAALDSSTGWIGATDIVGIGDDLPVIYAPIAWINQDLNKVIIFPKAQIASSPVRDSNGNLIKVSVTAMKVSTDDLKTLMSISGATVVYE